MTDIPGDDRWGLDDAELIEPEPNPFCPISAPQMAIKRLEPTAIIWHCDGIVSSDKWGLMQRAEGRWAKARDR